MIELLFKKFKELGSIRQTYRWFHEEKIELPVNKAVGGRFQFADVARVGGKNTSHARSAVETGSQATEVERPDGAIGDRERKAR